MSTRIRTSFENAAGTTLAAALELPAGPVHHFALFAHCFSCGKDIAAASRVARALAAQGFGVLRFDFTGLGKSDGDFGNAGFQSNIEDLLSAADFLRRDYRAPSLLIGHSLGGSAVLAAAADIPECRAVATIGAPAEPAHVVHQFDDQVDAIRARGHATVTLGGRPFEVSTAFLDSFVQAEALVDRVARLRRSLLVLHAPLDPVVSIDEASKLFAAARHPKSFISLDGADHLLSNAEDAQYVASTIATWAERYLDTVPEARPSVAAGQVQVQDATPKFRQAVYSDDHAWVADEPKAMGGGNLGPDPYEHLLAALGTCTSMTLRMYANQKQWPLAGVAVQLAHRREHAADCEDCEQPAARIDVLERWISLEGDLDASQRQRLMEIADRCPVHKTLSGELRIATNVATLLGSEEEP